MCSLGELRGRRHLFLGNGAGGEVMYLLVPGDERRGVHSPECWSRERESASVCDFCPLVKGA